MKTTWKSAQLLILSLITLQCLGITNAIGQPAATTSATPAVVTTNRPIARQSRETFNFEKGTVHISNEFEGARLSRISQKGPAEYTITIKPENIPINDAAWYAFKIWSSTNQSVVINLAYENGKHRYKPKTSTNRVDWTVLEPAHYRHTANSARLQLQVGPQPLYVSGQELFTGDDFKAWMDQMAKKPFVRQSVIGQSAAKRPIRKLEITEAKKTPEHVFILGRQHPPEVTGTLALRTFIETICGDTELARAFRAKFKVVAVPLINPDGVAEGHWRHNLHGVDLNRDWGQFNQPETRVIRDEFLKVQKLGKIRFGIDFHSTRYDVFYPVARMPAAKSQPVEGEDKHGRFLRDWLDGIQTRAPDYRMRIEPSDNGNDRITLVSTAWMRRTFDIPSVTYEVGDETDRKVIAQIASAAAETMMQQLLEKR